MPVPFACCVVPALINEGNFEAVAMFTVFFTAVLFDV